MARADPAAFRALPLRAHALLADVPLHDVWALDLPGSDGHPREVADLARLFAQAMAGAPLPVRALFGLRLQLGRLFGWDRERHAARSTSFAARLSEEDRRRSRDAPGSPTLGPFRRLYRFEDEAVDEIVNGTVHAFSLLALVPAPGGHRGYWAIYVKPVGRLTPLYMAAIDPFRRLLIYPWTIRRIEVAWRADARSGSRP